MATPAPTPKSNGLIPKPQRVLACVLCQQRKVKCDRKFPCENCNKTHVQCVPATLNPRRQKRRLPERELLHRLRRYEDLLHQNNINFEPSSPDAAVRNESFQADKNRHPDRLFAASTPSSIAASEPGYEAKNIWQVMSAGVDDSSSESLHEEKATIKEAWEQFSNNDHHLFFCSRKAAVELFALHPSAVHIFRLWQVYLDNVNPLLKVTHTPTLQARIVNATNDLSAIDINLEALMFSIYCLAVLSLETDDCQTMFGSSKESLLADYHFACQQALSNANFLRTEDHDCLTALYLYLVSVRSETAPRSLSSMLGVAVRIAQRIGIDNEACLSKYSVFEAEMRRRLWWSLVLFDTRTSEKADARAAMLSPIWDCRVLLNVNDSDLWPEMKELPTQSKTTDALFAVVSSEFADYVRHSGFHLDFTAPALKFLAKNNDLRTFEAAMYEKYLKFCSPNNSLHYMITWTIRLFVAKIRLLEHLCSFFKSSIHKVSTGDKERDIALSHTLEVLECDTKIMISPLTKGYHWFMSNYFPGLSYIHLVHDLRKRPNSKLSERAWEAMSENYDVRFVSRASDSLFFKIFAKLILQAWNARDAVYRPLGQELIPPRIVVSIRHIIGVSAPATESQTSSTDSAMKIHDPSIANSMNFGSPNIANLGLSWMSLYPDVSGDPLFGFDLSQSDLGTMDWP